MEGKQVDSSTRVILKEPNNTIFNNFTVTMGSGSSEKESDVFKGNGRAPWGSQILLLPGTCIATCKTDSLCRQQCLQALSVQRA